MDQKGGAGKIDSQDISTEGPLWMTTKLLTPSGRHVLEDVQTNSIGRRI